MEARGEVMRRALLGTFAEGVLVLTVLVAISIQLPKLMFLPLVAGLCDHGSEAFFTWLRYRKCLTEEEFEAKRPAVESSGAAVFVHCACIALPLAIVLSVHDTYIYLAAYVVARIAGLTLRLAIYDAWLTRRLGVRL